MFGQVRIYSSGDLRDHSSGGRHVGFIVSPDGSQNHQIQRDIQSRTRYTPENMQDQMMLVKSKCSDAAPPVSRPTSDEDSRSVRSVSVTLTHLFTCYNQLNNACKQLPTCQPSNLDKAHYVPCFPRVYMSWLDPLEI